MKCNNQLVKDSRDFLIIGAAGVGKTYFVENYVKKEILDDKPNIYRYYVTESSTYEDLFGSYMPQTKKQTTETEGTPQTEYTFIPGPLANALCAAYKESENKFIFFIENINAADTYEVFGNLFQLLDRKDNKSEYKVSVQNEVYDWFYDKGKELENRKIFLPKNLYVICTMNTSNTNGYKLDTAFRRRFKMVYITNDGTVYGNIPFYDETENDSSSNSDGNNNLTIKCNTDNKYISNENWNTIRKNLNEKIDDLPNSEDKKLTENFIKMVKFDNGDTGIGYIDFINSIVSHLAENVYRIDKAKSVLKHNNVISALTDMDNNSCQINIFNDDTILKSDNNTTQITLSDISQTNTTDNNNEVTDGI